VFSAIRTLRVSLWVSLFLTSLKVTAMAKQCKPFFRKSKNAWYVRMDGRTLSLGVPLKKNKQVAYDAWHTLIVEGVERSKQSERLTINELTKAFLREAS